VFGPEEIMDSTARLHVNDSRSSGGGLGLGPLEYENDIGHWTVVFELLTCIVVKLHDEYSACNIAEYTLISPFDMNK
jgi:hypothetical protein